jgi:DNA-binding NarL/FixJ family response regulator
MDKRIRVLVVDDHALFRESFSRLLEADTEFEVVGACATVREAISAICRDQIDVVLLDYELNDETGLRFLAESRNRRFNGHVLIVTSAMDSAAVRDAMNDGAAGILLKNSPLAELIPAIVRVARGERWVDPGIVRSLIDRATQTAKPTEATLSKREQEVLRGVFEGLTNKEISHNLGISEGSVKAALQLLFTRTGVRTRSQLVRIAVEKHSEDWLRSN